MHTLRPRAFRTALSTALLTLAGCSSDAATEPVGSAGGAGTSGAGGTSGSAGAGGVSGSGGSAGGDASGGASGSGGGGGSGGGAASGGTSGSGGTGGTGGNCTPTISAAAPAPAALLVVVDRSASMSTNGKWGVVSSGLLMALDRAAFDGLTLGLLAYPNSDVPAPVCLSGAVPTVYCGAPLGPQVAFFDAGSAKTTGSAGVRLDIAAFLGSTSPQNEPADASPGYAALQASITSLQVQPMPAGARRALVLLTDGGFSCTSLSTRPGTSDGQCDDWEYPSSILQLLDSAVQSTITPLSAFVVGLPGSATHGETQGGYASPPYSMLNALSAYAYHGSPSTAPAGCDGRTFTSPGTDPTQPCHFDLSNGALAAQGVVDAILGARRRAFGCRFVAPAAGFDPAKLNLQITTGSQPRGVPKRASSSNDCSSGGGCWDYDSGTTLEVLGAACDTLQSSSDARVELVSGCATIVQ